MFLYSSEENTWPVIPASDKVNLYHGQSKCKNPPSTYRMSQNKPDCKRNTAQHKLAQNHANSSIHERKGCLSSSFHTNRMTSPWVISSWGAKKQQMLEPWVLPNPWVKNFRSWQQKKSGTRWRLVLLQHKSQPGTNNHQLRVLVWIDLRCQESTQNSNKKTAGLDRPSNRLISLVSLKEMDCFGMSVLWRIINH